MTKENLNEEQLFNQGSFYQVYWKGKNIGSVKSLEEKKDILSEYKDEELEFVWTTKQQLNG